MAEKSLAALEAENADLRAKLAAYEQQRCETYRFNVSQDGTYNDRAWKERTSVET